MSATLDAYRALVDRDISLRQLMILAALDARPTGEATAAELSAATGITRNTLSYYYRALAKRGLVALRFLPVTGDRLVRLTQKGRAIAKATRLSNDELSHAPEAPSRRSH